MRNQFVKTLTECAREDERIFLIAVDLGYSVVESFASELPRQFLNPGIQEQNAVGLAAGLALSGRIVYVYSIVPFATMRCFEQIRVDLAYMDTRVRIVGVGAGLGYGPLGATHHAVEDLSILRSLPNMTVLTPGDPWEVDQLTRQSVQAPGPMYLRLGKGGERRLHVGEPPIEMGRAVTLCEGKDLTLFTTSNALDTGLEVAQKLRQRGLEAGVVHFHTLKPLDKAAVAQRVALGRPVFTLEEHSTIGGLGSAIGEIIAESGVGLLFRRFGLPDRYLHDVGSQAYLRKRVGIDSESLESQICRFLEGTIPI